MSLTPEQRAIELLDVTQSARDLFRDVYEKIAAKSGPSQEVQMALVGMGALLYARISADTDAESLALIEDVVAVIEGSS